MKFMHLIKDITAKLLNTKNKKILAFVTAVVLVLCIVAVSLACCGTGIIPAGIPAGSGTSGVSQTEDGASGTESGDGQTASGTASEAEVRAQMGEDYEKNPYLVSRVVKKDGKQYIEHLGKPYLYYGIQIRPDDVTGRTKLDDATKAKLVEDEFRMTKESGFDTVYFCVSLSALYNGSEYNFDRYKLYYEYAKKYDLKIAVQWQGATICGWCSRQKWMNESDYPIDSKGVLVLSNPKVVEWETMVLEKFLDWLYEFDTERRTVAISIGAEPDGNKGGETEFWTNNQYDAIVNIINADAKVVKNSKYQMVTFINLTAWGIQGNWNGKSYSARAYDLLKTGDLDFIGGDCYFTNAGAVESYESFLRVSRNEYIIPETSGSTAITLPSVLSVFSKGGGAYLYELKTLGRSYDLGVYKDTVDGEFVSRDGTDMVDRNGTALYELGTQDLLNFNACIKTLSQRLAVAEPGRLVVFNTAMKKLIQEKKAVGSAQITYTVDETTRKYGQTGAAFNDKDGSIYLFTVQKGAVFTISGKTFKTASIGTFVNGEWTEESSVSIASGTLQPIPGKVYKLVE